jgi:hypothetical protein
MRVGIAAGVATSALLALGPGAAPAAAMTCAGPLPSHAFDVVADVVALSGPSFDGSLVSPARAQVVRYRRGSGPRVIRVQTATFRDPQGRGYVQIPGLLEPLPGQHLRLLIDLPRSRHRIRAGEKVHDNACHSRKRPPFRLRRVDHTYVRFTPFAAPRPPVRAFLERGPRGLRCVAYSGIDQSRQRACERITATSDLVLDRRDFYDGQRHRAIIVASGKRLAGIAVGSAEVGAQGIGRIAVAPAPAEGRASVTVRLIDGTTRALTVD